MRYCKKCVMPDTRPYIRFDDEGVCYPCRHYEDRKNKDWKKRWGELEALADKHRGRNGDYYDCIIAASSGKDSYFKTYIFKEKLNMNPLLVSIDNFSWTETGRKNYDNLSDEFGVDIHLISMNRRTARKMLKLGFEKQLIPTWYWDKAVYAYPLQMSIKLGLPLVIWGENTSYERGGPIIDDTPDALVQLKNDVVKPVPWDYWLQDGITMKDLNPAVYPSLEEIEKAKVEARFLSYYVPWSDHENYENMQKRGFRSLDDTGEWKREGIHMFPWLQIDTIGYLVHCWFKFVKMGHWVVSDYTSLEIREGHMTREEAVKLVNEEEYKLDPKMLKDFVDFIGITEEHFWNTVDKFYNKDLVEKRDGVYRLKEPMK